MPTLAGYTVQVWSDMTWGISAELEEGLLDSGAPALTPMGYTAETVSLQCRIASAATYETLAAVIKAAIVGKTTIVVAGWSTGQTQYNGTFYPIDIQRREGKGYIDFTVKLKRA